MIGFLKKLFNLVNNMFKFEDVKVKIIEDKINLRNTATTDGKNNLPRSNSETFSNCENEALIFADEFRNKQIPN